MGGFFSVLFMCFKQAQWKGVICQTKFGISDDADVSSESGGVTVLERQSCWHFGTARRERSTRPELRRFLRWVFFQVDMIYDHDLHIVHVPGREFRFLAPITRQHLFLNLNQLILWRRIRICLLSFRQSCECCQTNGFARPVLRDRVSLATKVTCATAHSKVCSFCPHFRLFCSIIINFSKKFFAHQWLKGVYSTVGKVNFAFDAVWAPKLDFFDTILFDTDFVPRNKTHCFCHRNSWSLSNFLCHIRGSIRPFNHTTDKGVKKRMGLVFIFVLIQNKMTLGGRRRMKRKSSSSSNNNDKNNNNNNKTTIIIIIIITRTTTRTATTKEHEHNSESEPARCHCTCPDGRLGLSQCRWPSASSWSMPVFVQSLQPQISVHRLSVDGKQTNRIYTVV